MELRLALVALVACSGAKPKSVEDARAPRADAAARPAAPYRVDDAGPKGDVQIRVEWHDVPIAARQSPGRTCGTPRLPAVAPTTTWGIPDVLVVIAADHGKAVIDPGARVVVASCAEGRPAPVQLVPRAVIAGATLEIASEVEAPVQLALAKQGELGALAAVAAPSGKGRLIALPIAGHAVDVALEPGAIYVLAGDALDPAWIVTLDQPYAAITEPSGQVVVRDVPVGTYQVTSWLPPHGADAARLAHAQVTVAAGALAEVTLDLTAP